MTEGMETIAEGMAEVLPEGQGISVVWAEYASGDVPSSKSVTINASASDDSLRAIEGFLVEDLGVEG